jgi:hypothetical protein
MPACGKNGHAHLALCCGMVVGQYWWLSVVARELEDLHSHMVGSGLVLRWCCWFGSSVVLLGCQICLAVLDCWCRWVEHLGWIVGAAGWTGS